jgi:hypothetical protein
VLKNAKTWPRTLRWRIPGHALSLGTCAFPQRCGSASGCDGHCLRFWWWHSRGAPGAQLGSLQRWRGPFCRSSIGDREVRSVRYSESHRPAPSPSVPSAPLRQTASRYYRERLYGDRCLYELPRQPMLHLLATNVSSGGLSAFIVFDNAE